MWRKLVLSIVILIVAGLAWVTLYPPELIRVAANYTAKIICSNIVLAGRDPDEVLQIDVQAPGHPLLRLMQVRVERDVEDAGTVVRAGLFGFIGSGVAFGDKDRGCTALGDEKLLAPASKAPAFVRANTALPDAVWPEGNKVEPEDNSELDAVLNDEALRGPGMRAIVVVKDGRIIAERYGDGFDENTPLLGWSITKSVTGALVGAAVKEGYLELDDTVGFDGWQNDDRRAIRLSDMLGMASDLKWNEGYGSVSDVTRLLYLEPDTAKFAAKNGIDTQTPEPTGDNFMYSSGTTVLVSRFWQNAIGDDAKAAAFPSKALFEPLGMNSAVMETDAVGTFVGGSNMYATARDWARFGQLLLQRGAWQGRAVLPAGHVDWMSDPHPASGGEYGRGHVWLRPPREGDERVSSLPEGTFWGTGHDGQSIAVVPEHDLVVVRLGLTPSSLDYKSGKLTEAIIRAIN